MTNFSLLNLKLSEQNAFDLYRSIICFLLTNIGCIFFIYHYNYYFEGFSLQKEQSDIQIIFYDWNSTQYYFLSFLITDLCLMMFYSNWRKDLVIHHIISIIATITFWNKVYLIHLSMLLESYSMFNSIRILYPSRSVQKLLCLWRIFCIVSIRFSIFLYGCVLLYSTNKPYHVGFPFTFICLDTFWLSKNIQKLHKIQ